MRVIANILDVLLISSMLYTSYPQNVCINSELGVEYKITISEKTIKKELDYLKEDIKLPVLTGGKDAKNIKIINKIINNDILPKADEAEKASKDQFENIIQEKPRFPYEINSNYTVTTNNDKIISLYNDYYEYLGGAHGNTIRESYTIDKENEKLITLKELFNSEYNYKELINKKIKEEIDSNPQDYFYTSNTFEGIKDTQRFYIRDEKLVIYYELYEIAPYVKGIPEFEIPIELFGENFIYH